MGVFCLVFAMPLCASVYMCLVVYIISGLASGLRVKVGPGIKSRGEASRF